MDFSESKKKRGLICLALAAATIAVYWSVRGFDFVNFDDPDYVTENLVVRRGLSLRGVIWAFTHFYASNWHPLTWISHMLDCQLFGLHAGGPHLVNVALHAANGVLLFLLLERLTGAQWRSAMVAGLFALHPLHVESVAWIAERKDVVSTFFGLLALMAYARFSQSGRRGPNSKSWYVGAVVLFALSLMAKPMLVTMPFVLLLLDFWPLRRVENIGVRTFFTPQFRKLVLEKWPWFVLAAASSVVTFFAQKAGGAIQSTEYFPLTGRVTNAVTAYFEYVSKACWPAHLAVFYPLAHEQPAWRLAVAVAFILGVSLAAVVTIRRLPFFLVGWLWFLGTLVPVIGLVQVGNQAMADRYTYIPLTGLFIIVVWGGWELLRHKRVTQIIGAAAALALLVVFAVVTVYQLQYWRDGFALFTHTLAVTRENAVANNNLGTLLVARGRDADGLAHYAEAVRLNPKNASYQNNLATALARAGRQADAIEHYQASIQDDPLFAKAYSNLGALFLDQHHLDAAITNLSEAVRIDPASGTSRNNLGNALSAAGRLEDALIQYSEAVRLDPTNSAMHLNAGLALAKAGRANDAGAQFAEAVRLKPASPEARYELGRQLYFTRQFQAAAEQLGEAVRLRPDYAAAGYYLSAAEAEMGRFDEAMAIGNQALDAAQRTGQANLAARIQKAQDLYKLQRPLNKNGDN
ncbi:MAG TPA: tetratricopeptide repeat protein [Verrucomicrobiae bacterium]|nr:tetratricopeptide repeat protein [Verrucomicrobiae bacterium]